MRLGMLIFGLLACRTGDKPVVEDGPLASSDEDGDGYLSDEDCDDLNSNVYPGAEEICDGIDNSCDGNIDEGVSETFYLDADNDGFGDSSATVEACDIPEGYVANGSDCNDADGSIYPGAPELCDNIDNNCDSNIDEGLTSTYYVDADNDGWGDDSQPVEMCEPGEGYATQTGDCDDSEPASFPGNTEICDQIDNDCDGTIDDGLEHTFYEDQDSDGYGNNIQTLEACEAPSGYVSEGGDCDDSNTSINPGIIEVCDFEDNNCDGSIDENTAIDAPTWYADNDNDGFGNLNNAQNSCYQPNGYIQDSSDCDDGDNDIYPGAPELCSTVEDDDCDGSINEDSATDALTWYADTDSDGFGDINNSTQACLQPNGFVSSSSDCDDGNGAINPSVAEIIDNSTDDNCDSLELCYIDADNDGFRTIDTSLVISSLDLDCLDSGEGALSLPATDCLDADSNINPSAAEVCDGVDNDCDSTIDEDSATDALTWYADTDSDGFGDSNSTTQACNQPNGFVSNNGDCNDGSGAINPNATEICDGQDNDCDSLTDDPSAVDALTWYADTDSDGFGDSNNSTLACTQPSDFVSDNTDCNDGVLSINPQASEVCDSIDNNCDGVIDENTAIDAPTWYADNDNDTFGDANMSQNSCSQPNGYIQDSSDCDDGDNDIYPGAPELCSTADDDDCDGSINEDSATDALTWYADTDSDGFGDSNSTTQACNQPNGFVSNSGDCNDGSGAINPNATEICDGQDNDCDSLTDDPSAVDALTWFLDSDNDGFGNPNISQESCNTPNSYVSNSLDCDDSHSNANPNGTEVCDNLDNDCDGSTDENAVDALTWYFDNDNDGFGISSDTLESCDQPSSYADQDGDCNDNNSNVVACLSCDEILAGDPNAQTGIYELDPCGNGNTREFWCDMDRDGGGWTLAGWQPANAKSNMGVSDTGTVGNSAWSRNLSCMAFSEVMVFNDTLNQHFIQSYGAQVWSFTTTNLALGTNGNAFKHGTYGPSSSLIMMGCVNYQYSGGNNVNFACDSDGQSNAQGHLADYAGEYCSGGRLDFTWAWSNGSTCTSRGQQYTWGYAIR